MPYKDPEKRRASGRAYNKRFREKNPEAYRERVRLSNQQNALFRKELLAQFSCICCGEADPDLIEWHHVNPEDKKFRISDFTRSHNLWWEEVLKCVPVCVLCHRKIHTNKLCLLPPSP